MRFLPLSDESIRIAAGVLREGGLAAFPTETVYGLGGDGFNPLALARIFEAKDRPRFDPLIIHIAGMEGLDRLARLEALEKVKREKLEKLCKALWPGPLTLILPKRREVPDLATSGLPTLAVRLPAHPAARKLIKLSTGAVAAPSANPFGRLSPTRAEHVRDGLGDRVDIILNGGRSGVGVESTVLDISAEQPRILRPGGIPREQIEALIGPVEMGVAVSTVVNVSQPQSPGQLVGHYAPRTALSLHSHAEIVRLPYRAGEGRLFFDASSRDTWLQSGLSAWPNLRGTEPEKEALRVLTASGDLTEAAANLFDLLHQMDSLGLSIIRAEEAPPEGIGNAINDRLRRAAAAGS